MTFIKPSGLLLCVVLFTSFQLTACAEEKPTSTAAQEKPEVLAEAKTTDAPPTTLSQENAKPAEEPAAGETTTAEEPKPVETAIEEQKPAATAAEEPKPAETATAEEQAPAEEEREPDCE